MGRERMEAHKKAFKDMQQKLYKKKERQVKIGFLKDARKRGR